MQHTQFSNIDNLFPKYWKLFFEILKKSDSIKEESKINGFINLEQILLEWEMTVIHKQGILPESRIGVTVENYLSKIELPLVDCSERLKQLLVSQLKLERDKVVRPEDLFISTFQNVDALSGKIFAGNFNGKELSGLNDISILGEIKEEIINSKIREILHKSIIEKIGENCSIEKNMGVIKEIKATPRNVEPFLVQNWHFVMLNHGKIITNSHKLDINTGRVNLNTGFIGKNHGLVEKNNGVIQTNVALSGKKGGTVKGGKGLIVDYYNGEVINFISVGGNIKNDYKTMNEYGMILQSVNLKKDDLLADIREARKNEKSIDEYIVDKYRISENVLREALRFSLKDKFYEFKPKPDKQLIENFVIRAKKFFVKNLILPIAIYPHKAVFVTDDPSNPKRFTAIEELKRIKKDIFADKEIEIQKALWIDILKYINSFSAKPNTAQKTHELSMASKIESIDISVLEQELYDDKTKKEPINLLKSQKNSLNKFSLELREAPDEETKGDTVFNIEELIEEAKGSEIIELANNIILDGILDGASDIHI